MLRRTRWIWLVAAVLACGWLGAGKASAQSYVSGSVRTGGASISISYFYDALSPYGSWRNYSPYGYVWSPANVSADWRPYSDGRWVYSDYGWTWVDNESWGWGPMHYGRWVFADGYGWMWVPGTTWGPAWVAWSQADNYVGWAALPPDEGWSVGVSFSNFDVRRVPEREWCFVDRRDLSSSISLRGRILPESRNVAIFPRAVNVTRFSTRNGAPVNVGFDVRSADRFGGRQVPRMQVVDAQRPENGRTRVSGNQLQMFRGRVAPAPANAVPPRVSANNDQRGNGNPSRGTANVDNRGVRALPGARRMSDPSTSAAQNQQRQRFDLNQARNNGRQPNPSNPGQFQQRQSQANDAQVPRNRNGYPQQTVQQPGRARQPQQQYRQPQAPQAQPQGNGRGRQHGNGGQQAPPQAQPQRPQQSQPQPQQPQPQQPDRQNGNGNGNGHGRNKDNGGGN